MKRQTAGIAAAALYIGFLACIGLMIYLQIHGMLLYEVILLGVMFVLAMSMLWVSVKRDEAGRHDAKRRSYAQERK